MSLPLIRPSDLAREEVESEFEAILFVGDDVSQFGRRGG